MIKERKAIVQVVVVSLMLLIIVFSIGFIGGWFNLYQSEELNNIEQRTVVEDPIRIDYLKDGYIGIYNINDNNITITKIRISGEDCDVSGSYAPGLTEIPISTCLDANHIKDIYPYDVLIQTENYIIDEEIIHEGTEDTAVFVELGTCKDDLDTDTDFLSGATTIKLTKDIVNTSGICLSMPADATLDCDGHSITGGGSNIAIRNGELFNVTIKDCVFYDYGNVIEVSTASGLRSLWVDNVKVYNSDRFLDTGSQTVNMEYVEIKDSYFNTSDVAISFIAQDYSRNSRIFSNTFTNGKGIYLAGENHTIYDNTFTGWLGIQFAGSDDSAEYTYIYNNFFNNSDLFWESLDIENVTFYANYFEYSDEIYNFGTWPYDHFFNYTVDGNMIGNYWNGFSCTTSEIRGPYTVCTNPENRTIRAANDLYDNAPLTVWP